MGEARWLAMASEEERWLKDCPQFSSLDGKAHSDLNNSHTKYGTKREFGGKLRNSLLNLGVSEPEDCSRSDLPQAFQHRILTTRNRDINSPVVSCMVAQSVEAGDIPRKPRDTRSKARRTLVLVSEFHSSWGPGPFSALSSSSLITEFPARESP